MPRKDGRYMTSLDYDVGYKDGSDDIISRNARGSTMIHTPGIKDVTKQSPDCIYWQGHHDGYNKKTHQMTKKSWEQMNSEAKGSA